MIKGTWLLKRWEICRESSLGAKPQTLGLEVAKETLLLRVNLPNTEATQKWEDTES